MNADPPNEDRPQLRPANLAPLPALIGHIVVFDADGPLLEPAQMAEALGISTGRLREALRAGQVFSLVERGEGEDAGRHRLTLRHRATEAVLVVDADGRVIAASRRGPGGAAATRP